MTIFKKFFVLFLFIALIMSVTGCSPTAPTAPTVPTATQTPIVEATTIPPTETPLPTATATPFVPKATIKIVSQAPASTDIAHAAELAVEQLQGSVNNLGYKVEFVPYDDQQKIDVAITNAKQIVKDPQVLCGVGHYNSPIMIQASQVYHAAGLAFISPSSTNPSVTDSGYLEVNRVIGRDDGEGIAAAQFIQAQGYKSVYIFSATNGYAQSFVPTLKQELGSLGIKIVGVTTTDITSNFQSIVSKVMAANPDVIYYSGSADQGGPFFNEARAEGYKGPFLSMSNLDDSSVVTLAGPFLTDGGGMYYTQSAAPASAYPDAQKFAQDFQIKYGASPQWYAAQAYDAAGICLKAIEEASKAKGGDLPTRAEVAQAIRALKDYKGITGTYNFNKNGDLVPAKYFVFKVMTLDPNNWGQNTIVATFNVEPPK